MEKNVLSISYERRDNFWTKTDKKTSSLTRHFEQIVDKNGLSRHGEQKVDLKRFK